MKRRFVTLDAMRGIAALVVVGRHFTDATGGHAAQFSYLAVDVFFLLSGFVLSLSYRRRFDAGMSPAEFMKLRVIRLYPLYFVGISLGLAIEVLHNISGGNFNPGALAVLAATNLLMLPSPTWNIWTPVFPALIPGWSLFFELYVANGLFAVLHGRLTPRLRGIVYGSAMLLIVAEVMNGSLGVGSTWSTFIGGFPRVCFSFFAGVLLQRLHQRYPPQTRVPSWLILAVLATSLSITVPGLSGRLYECACVFLIFPALIYWGAEAIERYPWVGSALGDVSYAVYVIHYPLLEILAHVRDRIHRYPLPLVEALFFAAVVSIAYALHRYYDEPVRAAISRWRERCGPARYQVSE
jgi:peptidoglycan/LPS O-acetylase OafA/YrhL